MNTPKNNLKQVLNLCLRLCLVLGAWQVLEKTLNLMFKKCGNSRFGLVRLVDDVAKRQMTDPKKELAT